MSLSISEKIRIARLGEDRDEDDANEVKACSTVRSALFDANRVMNTARRDSGSKGWLFVSDQVVRNKVPVNLNHLLHYMELAQNAVREYMKQRWKMG